MNRYEHDFEPRPLTMPNGAIAMCSRVHGIARSAVIEYRPSGTIYRFVLTMFQQHRKEVVKEFIHQLDAIAWRRDFLMGYQA